MRQWRIGRAPDCEVILEHAKVSRYHAMLTQTPGGLVVRDLDSRGGTSVNGVRVPSEGAPVRVGDVIAFGKHEVPTRHGPLAAIFEAHGEPDQAPPVAAPVGRLQPAPTTDKPPRPDSANTGSSAQALVWLVASVIILVGGAAAGYLATRGDDAQAAA